MGKGIAKTFKQVYPEMFEQYLHLCETKALTVGKLWLFKTSNKWVLNFPTKTTWRKPSRLEYLEEGLIAFVNGYAERGITSIAFPALGCGNGELHWEGQVRPLMEKYLKPLPIDIFIYLYEKSVSIPEHRNNGKKDSIPEHRNIKDMAAWLREEPELLTFEEVWIDLAGIISDGIQLKSFYNDKAFQVNRSEKEKGIFFDSGNSNEFIGFEELENFWRLIRRFGFGFGAVIPPDVAPYQGFLLSLFSELPYCHEITASKNYQALGTEESRGIQYIPRSSDSASLFLKKTEQLTAV
jgi:hypothetical protein